MLAEITQEQLAAVLDQLAESAVEQAGLKGPPIDAFLVAERLGLVVAWDATQRSRARYVRLRPDEEPFGYPTILVRPDPRTEREQWAVAHEIGEHLAVTAFRQLGVDPPEAPADARERLAGWLASRLLLPVRWLVAQANRCSWDLRALKARFTTASHELIARRMLDFDPAVLITIVDHGTITFRRSNVGLRPGGWLPGEHACWLAAHRGAQPAQWSESAYRVRAWPVHEPGWKREIVRTELHWEYTQCAEM